MNTHFPSAVFSNLATYFSLLVANCPLYPMKNAAASPENPPTFILQKEEKKNTM